MESNRSIAATSLMAVCLLLLVSGFATAQTVKIEGMITGRTGDSMTMNTAGGPVTVTLDDNTKVQRPKGLGIRKQQMTAAVLIPGLKVKVEGTGDPMHLLAKTITYDKGDL